MATATLERLPPLLPPQAPKSGESLVRSAGCDWSVFGNCPGFLCFGIRVRIGAAHKPEYRRNVPLSSERAKIFTRGSWLSIFHAVRSEVVAKCFDCAFCCF